jgi:DNA adenine methylase
MSQTDLTKLSKKELLEKCEELGITRCKSKNKGDIIELIKNVKNSKIEFHVEEEKTIICNNESKSILKEKMNICKPFLKWVGGKTQILEEVLCVFPKDINNYHEPFLGGGSVLIGLLSYIKYGKIKISGKIYASDLNSNLIGLYKNIQYNLDKLIIKVKEIVNEFNNIEGKEVNRKCCNIEEAKTSQESYYFWIRKKFNSMSKEIRTSVDGSAMLLFMNKTCFRGVYREGPNGFNVPFGNYKNPSIFEEEHLGYLSELIKDVIFTNCSFEESLKRVIEGDFVYMDPPYCPETEKSFVSYTIDGFNIDSHRSLFKICNDMNLRGIKFLMSNSDVRLLKDAFPESLYKTKIISCRRAINSKNPESKTNEVLINN